MLLNKAQTLSIDSSMFTGGHLTNRKISTEHQTVHLPYKPLSLMGKSLQYYSCTKQHKTIPHLCGTGVYINLIVSSSSYCKNKDQTALCNYTDRNKTIPCVGTWYTDKPAFCSVIVPKGNMSLIFSHAPSWTLESVPVLAQTEYICLLE